MQQYQYQEVPIRLTVTVFMHFYYAKHGTLEGFRDVAHDPLAAMMKAAQVTEWPERQFRTTGFVPHEGITAVPEAYSWMTPGGQGPFLKPHRLLGARREAQFRPATLPELLLFAAVSDEWPGSLCIPYNKKQGRTLITYPSQSFGDDEALALYHEPGQSGKSEQRQLRLIRSSAPISPVDLVLFVSIDQLFMHDLPSIGMVCVQ